MDHIRQEPYASAAMTTTSDSSNEAPGADRRFPRRDDPDYLGSAALSRAVRAAIATQLEGRAGLDIVDVGCGEKPFRPFFAGHASSYLGTDVFSSPSVDRVCPAEALDVDDACADVVLCLSVLEHVNSPQRSVAELSRILRPGGVVFASTHGAFPWHPYPQDHWRWTQTGLPILFEHSGNFESIEISATRGTFSGMFFLLAHYAYGWASKTRPRQALRGGITTALNLAGEWIDTRTPGLHDLQRPVTAIPEFFIVARKAPAAEPSP